MLLSRETRTGIDQLVAGSPVVLRTKSSAVAKVPPQAGRLFGYTEERAHLQAAVDRGRPAVVGIRGAGGAGKTEILVRALADQKCIWQHGSFFVAARDLAADDIIALVADAVFGIEDARARPPLQRCKAKLRRRRMLVGLDDMRSAEDLAAVRAALSSSFICFTSDREFENAADEWVALNGLATDDGVAFLQSVAQQSSPDEATARSVVENLQGNPSRIRCAGVMGVPLQTIAAECTSPDAFDRLQLSLLRTKLPSDEIVALGAVAIFGEAALVDRKAAGVLAKGSFLERSAAGWAVPQGLRRALGQLVDDGKASELLLEVLRRANRIKIESRDLVECAAGMLSAIGSGGEPARAAGKLVARELDRHGLWNKSAAIYEALRASATTAGDSSTVAWATNQLGVHRACLGDLDSARELLERVLVLQQRNGEVASRALTEANLAQLQRITRSTMSRGRLMAAGILVGTALLIVAGAMLAHLSASRSGVVASVPNPAPRQQTSTQKASWHPRVRSPHGHAVSKPPLAQAIPSAAATISSAVATMPPATATISSAVATAAPRVVSRIGPIARPKARIRPTAPPKLAVNPPRHLPSLIASLPHRPPSAAPIEQETPPQILVFSLLPKTVSPGGSATLCVSADNARELSVSGVGAFDPKVTSCRSVSAEKTTTFVASATNKEGQEANRSMTLTVVDH